MAAGTRRDAPDQRERDAAVAERARNVVIDAGAGTGKTTILVDRLVEMIAPTTDAPGLRIDRLAAITFTRKAAGELRLRIRERLLGELATPALDARRERDLREALAGLDTAYVGTVASVADRLLRLRPVEARLSPGYDIAEDEDELVGETFVVLMEAAQGLTLETELAGTPAAPRAAEATRTISLAVGLGLPAESRELEWVTLHGLASLVAGFIGQRDVPPPDVEPAPFDVGGWQVAADAVLQLARSVRGGSTGASWIARLASALPRLRALTEPAVLFRELRRLEDARPRDVTKGETFGGDDTAWKVWKRIRDGEGPQSPALWKALRAPLDRWLATRLVRLFPVVVTLYERVKARRRALDQLDLLVKLRDLLARDRAVRGEFQQMFDHVFVDEFQDTDPLQAEIVLYLCEHGPVAERWEDVRLRDGALTLVGDPKQSIYRFRRADIAMYERVRQVVVRSACLEVTLSANFRSTPSLIAWLNERFDRVLGAPPVGRRDDASSGRHAPPAPPVGRRFDPRTGAVFNQRLRAGREGAASRPVHVVPFDFVDGGRHLTDEYRELEGAALARYLTWLVRESDVTIQDPLDGRARRVRHGDVAILALSTWRLPLLFPALDAAAIPWASRGGALFLGDPLHRQFLLGLRALADPDDGVAEAALLRPPFFALDLGDLLLERSAEPACTDEPVLRAREARALASELRRRRFERAPGATARDLLERTAFARTVALEPNGPQRLARLRELCLVLEQQAAADGLDYDGVTARMRGWIDDPVQLDPPYPVGVEAVQVLTVHQAKGLEFPVVVLWDGRGQWDARLDTRPWRMERDGRGWVLALNGLAWEEPADLGIGQAERDYASAERRRVVYVAATRARDVLVLPHAGEIRPGRFICADLVGADDPALVRRLPTYHPGTDQAGTSVPLATDPGVTSSADAIEREVIRLWTEAAAAAAAPRFRPVAVSGEAHASIEDSERAETTPRARPGRFGSVFGSAVHHAIADVLHDRAPTVEEAVRRGAARVGLTERLAEASEDVARALRALAGEGVVPPLAAGAQLEYPVAGPWPGGLILAGYVDLLVGREVGLDVIDFKTDAPPTHRVEESHPEYVRQVHLYARLLEDSGVARGRPIRCGLLFTADGVIRWTGRP